MMSCRAVRESLPEYASGRVIQAGDRIAAHLACCTACAAAERELRAVFAALATTPGPPASVDGEARARAALGAAAADPAPAKVCGARSVRPLAGRLGLAVAVAFALVAFVPWRGARTGAAAVEAAVQRANTWHLVGWKLRGGRRVPWEIWGRRSPFFYCEQLGDELNFDDGKQRVRMAPAGPNGQMFALRLESGPAPSDMWREWLTMGTGWRNSRAWHETRDGILVFAGSDCGMQGPYSVADTYFTLDKRTWLPVRYEYRQHCSNSKAPAWVLQTLDAAYDVPLPDSVTTLRLPPGVMVADTLTGPTDPSIPPPGGNVQRAHGLTVQVSALAMDPDGNILVRIRAWLGNLKLGAEGTATWNCVETDVKYRTFGQTQDTAYHTDDGRPYVEFSLPRLPLDLVNGDVLKLLTPLEPRPAGMALPHSLTLDLQMTPQIVFPGEQSSVLFDQSFIFTLPLPANSAPIDIDAYLPPGHRQRFHYASGADDSTIESNIASARAHQYEVENDFDRSIYWQKQALAAIKPFTNTAQFDRIGLGHTYQEAGDVQRAVQWYREVIAVSRQHPETWNYYAYQARQILNYMATHPPRRGARKRSPDRATLKLRAALHAPPPPQ